MKTTQSTLNTLVKTIGDLYADELKRLPFKPKTRECLIDGFRAGVQAGVTHTIQMLDIEVEKE